MKQFFTTFAFVILSGLVFCQEWEWINPNKPIMELGGVWLTNDSTLIGFTGFTHSGVYFSNNNGSSWTSPNTEHICPEDVYFLSDSLGFLVGQYSSSSIFWKRAKMMKTVDGGIHWNSVYFPEDYDLFYDCDFFGDSIGMMVGLFEMYSQNRNDACVLKTTDKGQNWEPITVDSVQIYAVSIVDRVTAYIGGEHSNGNGAFLKTNDGGLSWTTINNNIKFKNIDFLNTSVGIATGLWPNLQPYITHDGGNTWECIDTTGLEFWTAYITQDSVFYFVGQGGNILRSDDKGLTWTKTVLDTHKYIYDISFNSNNVGVIVGDGGCFYKTFDGGITWENQLESTTSQHFLTVESYGNSLMAAGTSGDFYTSDNAGKTWGHHQLTDSTPFNESIMINEHTAYFTRDHEVVKTTDGGFTWQSVFYHGGDINSVNFLTEDLGYICTYHHIISTKNGGLSWDTIATGNFRNMMFVSQDTGFYIDEMGLSLYGTSNGGTTWAQINSNISSTIMLDVFFITPKIGFSIQVFPGSMTEDPTVGLYKTIDGGNVWFYTNYISSGSLHYCDFDFINERYGIAVLDNSLYFTPNYGNSWINVGPLGVALTSATMCSSGVVVAVGPNGTIIRKKMFPDLSGVDEAEAQNSQIMVLPNPATDKVTVIFPRQARHLKLYDLAGLLQLSVPLSANQVEQVLSINSLNPGLYVLKLEMADGKIFTSKLMKL